MHLEALHERDKEVSAASAFSGEHGTVTAIHLKANAELKEHLSKSAAWLLCVNGEVNYEDERGYSVLLHSGEFQAIEPMLRHRLLAKEDSHLILVK